MPRGSNRQPGAPALKGAGRPASRAILEAGRGVFVTHVAPEGTTDLARGVIGKVERIGQDRLVIIPQEDGSEIRILVVS